MPTAIKPNGKEIEINDNSAKYLPKGWKLKGEKEAKKEEKKDDTELDALRDEFEKVTGKKPHHKLGADKMREVIEGK